jgi:hypothetical protein
VNWGGGGEEEEEEEEEGEAVKSPFQSTVVWAIRESQQPKVH